MKFFDGLIFFFIFSLLILLNGCSTVAYHTANDTASVINDNLSLGTQIQDKTIEYKARYRLHELNYSANKNFIDLVVYDGRLVLLGEVESKNTRALIDHELASIPEVYKLDDYLSVGKKHSWIRWSQDALMTEQIEAKIFLSHANHFHYSVHTCNGVVYLFGAASKQEEKYIVEKIRVLPGVKKVVTIFPQIRPNKATIIDVTPVALNV